MYTEDIELAKRARLNAHSPYSHFQVGAALRAKNGKVYLGCNIENHGIQGICAERTAFAKALSEGEREFECITVVGSPKGIEPTEKCMPCGYCRQFMSEFVNKDLHNSFISILKVGVILIILEKSFILSSSTLSSFSLINFDISIFSKFISLNKFIIDDCILSLFFDS